VSVTRVTGTVRRAGLAADPAALGITYRQLDHWVRGGYLQPGRNWAGHAKGPGSPRMWPPGELEIARRMGRLTAAGLPPALAARFARELWPGGEIAPGIWIEVEP
jgi:hypothetical protein